jgi:hypothetical protein
MPTIQGRWVKSVGKIESTFIPKIKRMITASDSYANWFVKEYRINKPVVVKKSSEEIRI